MSSVVYRSYASAYPTIVSGRGLWLRDSAGREYLDAVSGGAAVSCLGHGEPRVAAAIARQLGQIGYVHGSFFTTEPAEALAETLLKDAPAGMAGVLFASGGSEAVETALKLVRQSWIERGRPEKSRILSRRQSYHGATLGALAVSGNTGRRQTYAPMLFDAHFIDPCYAYRLQQPGETLQDYALRAADELERAILEIGPQQVAAFIAEPVVGATLGCVPAAPGYLRRVREICDKYDVLLVLDEIMCGSGRSGPFYACSADGVSPDLITIAKGLAGGYQPLGAVVASAKVLDPIRQGSGALKHGLTYMGHPVACAAALEVQRIVAEDGLLQNVRLQGRRLLDTLATRLAEHPHVGDVRGRGLFVGVELVADRRTKAPFDPALALNAKVKSAALAHGLMVYPGGGTVDGTRGDHVLFAPAYTVTAEEVEEIAGRFCASLDAALASLPHH